MNNNIEAISLPKTGERNTPECDGDNAFEHIHRYAFAAAFSKGRTVLDIACGEGYGSALLAEVAGRVLGVDIAPEVVAHAQSKYGRSNLEFKQGECVSMPVPDRSFDLVVSFETIEHFEDHTSFFAEIKRLLKPGGMLIISSPERANYTDKTSHANPFHKKELYREEFENLLSRFFHHHRIFGQRVVHGSLMAPAADFTTNPLRFLEGDYLQQRESVTLANPVYLIAMASDDTLDSTGASFFESASLKTNAERDLMSVRAELDQLRRSLDRIKSILPVRIALSFRRWLRRSGTGKSST